MVLENILNEPICNTPVPMNMKKCELFNNIHSYISLKIYNFL
jgi:hypothetical protein